MHFLFTSAETVIVLSVGACVLISALIELRFVEQVKNECLVFPKSTGSILGG